MAKHTRGWLLGCGLLSMAGLMVVVSLAALWNLGGSGSFLGAISGNKVGLVVIEGPITGSRHLVDEIEAHRRDPAVRAVVIRVESPGGGVAPSQEIHDAILRLRAEKPVVASLGSVAASGGYYAAVAADSIVANPGTLTGSIGVIFEFPTFPDLLEKLGVRYQVYKSGSMKDIGSFSREPTEAEDDVLDAIIDDVYAQFVDAVVEGRGLPREQVLAAADGRVFTGRQALDAGLVDRLGGLHEAVLLAADMAGISGDPEILRKTRPVLPWLHLLDRILRENSYFTSSRNLSYRFR